MDKRKKRLERGIESLDMQEKIHKEKRKLAEKLGEIELVGYYDQEIEKFKREIRKKKDKLERK